MKRELEFRLKYEGVLVGYERHRFDKTYKTIIIEHSKDNKLWKNSCGDYISHDQKEQYIGRKDKKEIKIYENDTVCGLHSEGDEFEGNVVFLNGDFGVSYKVDGKPVFLPVCEFTDLSMEISGGK